MFQYDILIIALITGAVTKLVDIIEDFDITLMGSKNITKIISAAFGMIYGFLIAYTIINSSAVAPLWIGSVLGVMICKKFDAWGHYFGLATIFILLIYYGLPSFNYIFIIVFTLAAILDEFGNDYADSGKVKNKMINKFFTVRPFLEISAFLMSVLLNQWIIFAAILLFDAGYIFANEFGKKLLKMIK